MGNEMALKIQLARSHEDFAEVGSLIRQYVEWLGLDLSFQSYNEEINDLVGKYHSPASAMFLARLDNSRAVGCCGFSPIHIPHACETKRLFVLPEARGRKIAQALMSAVMLAAEATGYEKMFLDTLPSMTAAIHLYETLGFEQVAPYYSNPIGHAMFFCKSLSSADR